MKLNAPSGLTNIISHTDLDGVVAAALGWYANSAAGDPIRISLTGYGEVDNLILDGLRKNDRVVALDLSPQFQNTVDEIDKIFTDGEPFLFDHHQSAYDKIGRRAWAVVDTKRCGAAVYRDWLMAHGSEEANRRAVLLEDMVEIANDRDLWINENPDGRLWQAMVTVCGEWGALARLISNPSAVFTAHERALVERFTAAQEERFKRAQDRMVLRGLGGGAGEMAFLGDGYLEFGDTSDFCGSILDRPDAPGDVPAIVVLAFRRPSGTWAVSLRSRDGLSGKVVSLLKDGRSIRGGGHDDAAALYFPASYNEKSIMESIHSALATSRESSKGMGVTLGDLLKGSAR